MPPKINAPIGLKEWLAMPENEKKRLEAIAKNKAVREAKKKERSEQMDYNEKSRQLAVDRALIEKIIKKNENKRVWGVGYADLSSVGMNKSSTVYWIEGKGSKLIANIDIDGSKSVYEYFDGDKAKKLKKLLNKERNNYISESMPGNTSDYDYTPASSLIKDYLESGGNIQNVLNFYK